MIAGSDCGFATFAGSKEVHPSIVWAKLQALTEGARLASKELWKKAGQKKAGKTAAKKKAARGRRNNAPHPAGSTSSARRPPIGAVPRLSAPP